jgi:glycosyltransferase involved in cell wall biosynthesis
MNYKFSIITPEHSIKNIPFLVELYESILSQTYDNWEWVLYLNGEVKIKDIPDKICSDERVKIYNGITNPNVGFIKNKAFFLGKGDILVEVDHDDLLSEDCLEELNAAYQDPEVGFVYSEDLLYDMRGDEYKVPWNSDNGWTYKWMNFRGEDFIKIDMFPPTSHSIGIIWYAPDHVRSWRKDIYHKLGGHNPELNICDDHDLVIRTYLETKFKFIPKVLYYYRWLPGGDNTQLQRIDAIQVKTFELFHQYGQALAERDADLNGLLKVDIGGGLFPRPGYLTVDKYDADVICDLDDGIPLPDNSVGVINASHVLEHLKDPVKSMSEIYRVLCDGGWAFIEVPSTDGRGAWQDPTHVSYWNENSFWYYTRKEKAQFIRNETIRFQEFRLDTVWWDNNIAVTNAWLCAIKSDNKRPHPVRI